MKPRHSAVVALIVIGIAVLVIAAYLGFAGANDPSMTEASGGLTMAISGMSLAAIGLVIFPRS